MTCLDHFRFHKKVQAALHISPSAQGAQNSDSDKGAKGRSMEMWLFTQSAAKGLVYGDRQNNFPPCGSNFKNL